MTITGEYVVSQTQVVGGMVLGVWNVGRAKIEDQILLTVKVWSLSTLSTWAA